MSYLYTLYELNIAVPFPCPMLIPAPDGAVIDVTIVEGNVPYNLPSAKADVDNWQATPGRFLLRGGRRSGRFLVEDGQRITLQRNPSADNDRLFTSLTTGVIAALLCQRGQLVLHASVVMTPRGAVAISGESGVGKSTTQATLLARGCSMLTDDVTVLRQTGDGPVMVLPGISKINLCDDAVTKLGFDVASLQRNPLRQIKVVFPVDQSSMVKSAVPLKEIYLLKRHSGRGLNISTLAGFEKFRLLQECFYGPLFPEEHPGMFATLSALVDQIKMKIIERPTSGCSVNKVTEAILNG
jgi:hypothetical protein